MTDVINIFEFRLKSKPSYLLFQHLANYVGRGGHLNWEDRMFYDELCKIRRSDESRHPEIVDLLARLIEAGLFPYRTIQ